MTSSVNKEASPSVASSLGSSSTMASMERQIRNRWRHVSSPSVSTTSPPPPPSTTASTTLPLSRLSGGDANDVEMTDLPIRIRAMSTSCQPSQQLTTTTDAPLFDETSLKYLESQLSPESLLMEDTTASEEDNNAAPWFMSDFVIKKEPAGAGGIEPMERSPASPPETPDPSSLSPPVLYATSEEVMPALTPIPVVASPVASTASKLSRCDLLTRTKNPVLPSVYIDNSLIVPEPSKQKYHNTNPSSTLLGMSVDNGDLNEIDLGYFEALMDDKETLFP